MTDRGRSLAEPAFPDDDGKPTPAVSAALADYGRDPARYPDAVAALAADRLLVPVVAVLGEVEVDEAGLARDKSADMAVVLITGRDGRTALLAFTSTDSMAAWNPDARPVSVPFAQAVEAAADDGAAAIVVDIAGPVPITIELDRQT